MARFIQESPEEFQDDEELNNFEEPQQEAEEPNQDVEAKEPELPEKYQGKSIKDIVQMHQEAEKLLGRQSSEVGELRRIVDDFVKTQLEAPSPQQKTKIWISLKILTATLSISCLRTLRSKKLRNSLVP